MIPSHGPLISALRAYIRHAPPALSHAPLIRYVDQELARHPRTALTRTRDGDLVAVVTNDLIQRYLYLHGVWEPNLTAWIRRRLSPGDTFIDIGAHTGYYTLLASRQVGPSGRVVAIEASPVFHTSLTEAIHRNTCHNVRTANIAVADAPRTLTLYLQDAANLGNTSAVRPKTTHSSFEVKALPLPQILRPEELAAARLIKIDVEGTEASLMQGLVPALGQLRDDVELVIEVTPRSLAKQGQSVNDVVGPLRAAGFHVYRIANDYDPASYPGAVRRPAAPVRWDGPVSDMSDLVFSRKDSHQLGSVREANRTAFGGAL
ncbi:FkbM family methyltransferase [Streptomyces sp. NPDC048331]|uniref:FkbM family methyltransferase n=1 Tax=Streptomyces sp. NPDC048331 TaxID=3365534 RepID=UPI0037172465